MSDKKQEVTIPLITDTDKTTSMHGLVFVHLLLRNLRTKNYDTNGSFAVQLYTADGQKYRQVVVDFRQSDEVDSNAIIDESLSKQQDDSIE